jgi:hypothetical protein
MTLYKPMTQKLLLAKFSGNRLIITLSAKLVKEYKITPSDHFVPCRTTRDDKKNDPVLGRERFVLLFVRNGEEKEGEYV